jgi:hypothetical protein
MKIIFRKEKEKVTITIQYSTPINQNRLNSKFLLNFINLKKLHKKEIFYQKQIKILKKAQYLMEKYFYKPSLCNKKKKNKN